MSVRPWGFIVPARISNAPLQRTRLNSDKPILTQAYSTASGAISKSEAKEGEAGGAGEGDDAEEGDSTGWTSRLLVMAYFA